MFSSKIDPRGWWLVLVCLGLLIACSPPRPEITPTKAVCGAFIIDGHFACVSVSPTGYLVQSPTHTQVTVQIEAAHITIEGTAYLNRTADELTIATLEGVSVVGANNITRVVQPGAQITLPIATGEMLRAVTAPSAVYPFDITPIQLDAFTPLERKITIPPPIAPPPDYTPPTATVTLTSTAVASPLSQQAPVQPTPCVPREDWSGRYTIQRGDTLSIIAQRFNMSVIDLKNGNCITDPNRIRTGQILYWPEAATLNDTPTPPTGTPTTVEFRAEQDTLQPGQCTTVTWKIENVKAVYFEDEVTTGRNNRQVCPAATTNYTLLVIYPDGNQQTYNLTISVLVPTEPL